jgi:hypothetical protein
MAGFVTKTELIPLLVLAVVQLLVSPEAEAQKMLATLKITRH